MPSLNIKKTIWKYVKDISTDIVIVVFGIFTALIIALVSVLFFANIVYVSIFNSEGDGK